ncbi:MAG TPA: hypothetical protein VJX69_12690 [Terriglobales bacterium]|nr:hypothetical protein [Terriglobales bacterium]
MKKALILLLFLLPATLMWLSCGSSAPSGSTQTSGLKYRAFITNNVSSGSGSAGIFIVNAVTDVRPIISPISAGNTPGMMVLTPNRAQTVVFSGNGTQFSDNQLSLVNNAAETVANKLTLPGITESFVVSPDSSSVYVAVPTAPVVGQSPGIMVVVALNSGSITGEVEVPSLHYLSMDNSGNRILGFSDNSDAVAVITPSNIGIPGSSAVSLVSGFDHPVAAFFTSDDTTAYVVNCGAECGGTQASIQTLDLTNNTSGPSGVVCTQGGNPQCVGTLDLPAASVALVNGSTIYVAGTPVPPQPCPAGTAAQTCGLLTILDLSSLTVTNSGIVITDGYHNRIALGANGQLFIGARTCTEISTATETRGCLSIYNTLPATKVGSVPPGGVLIPPANGDVTGIQPIPTRDVVYVVQNFALNIYDDTIDALEYNPNDPYNPGQITNLIGQFVDVKTVDF